MWWVSIVYALYVIKWSYFVSNLNKQIVKAVSCKPNHKQQHGSQRKYKERAERIRGVFRGMYGSYTLINL